MEGFSTADDTLPTQDRIKHWYRELPEKKRYFEFVSAFLTIPLLVVTLINSTSNLASRPAGAKLEQSPTPTGAGNKKTANAVAAPIVITLTPKTVPTEAPTPQPTAVLSQPAACKKSVGPVSIVSPSENATVTSDPVCVEISRTGEDYCGIAMSYRLDSGIWSEYLDKSVCMYGLSGGDKKLDLKIRSIASDDEIFLKRAFTVFRPTPTSSPTATGSGSLIQ